MKRIVFFFSLMFVIQLPLVAIAENTDAFIPLFAITKDGNMQSVYNISNTCGVATQVKITFTKNDGTPLAGHPIRLAYGTTEVTNLNQTACISPDCVSPTNAYSDLNGMVVLESLPAKQQMFLVLLGNSELALTGWGRIDASTGSCLLANGLIRNGPNNPTVYSRPVQISEKPF